MTMRRGASQTQLNVSFIAPVVIAYLVLYGYNNYITEAYHIDSNKVGFNSDIKWEYIVGFVVVVGSLMVYRGAAEEPGVEYETAPSPARI